MPTFNYTVDGEGQSTDEHTLTPNQILENAGLDPALYYLVEIKGQHQESYKDKGAEDIQMHQKMKFTAINNGPMTVS